VNASLNRGIRMSLNTVMKPHMKNNTVMIANGPRYVWVLPVVEDCVGLLVVVLMVAIFWSCCCKSVKY